MTPEIRTKGTSPQCPLFGGHTVKKNASGNKIATSGLKQLATTLQKIMTHAMTFLNTLAFEVQDYKL